jgi:hypothetical protein
MEKIKNKLKYGYIKVRVFKVYECNYKSINNSGKLNKISPIIFSEKCGEFTFSFLL